MKRMISIPVDVSNFGEWDTVNQVVALDHDLEEGLYYGTLYNLTTGLLHGSFLLDTRSIEGVTSYQSSAISDSNDTLNAFIWASANADELSTIQDLEEDDVVVLKKIA